MQKPCCVCGKFESLYGSNMCIHCRRKHANAKARANRQKKREERMREQHENGAAAKFSKPGCKKHAGVDITYRFCSKCTHERESTEFEKREDGTLSDICDRCRLAPYLAKYDLIQSLMFGKNFWRKRAYSINTTAWRTYAVQNGFDPKRARFDLLPWVCKPRHLAELYEQQGGLCKYCSEKLTNDNLSIDHKTPRTRGGAHSFENLALVCHHCNNTKHNCTEPEFYEYIKRINAQCVPVVEAADKEPQRQ